MANIFGRLTLCVDDMNRRIFTTSIGWSIGWAVNKHFSQHVVNFLLIFLWGEIWLQQDRFESFRTNVINTDKGVHSAERNVPDMSISSKHFTITKLTLDGQAVDSLFSVLIIDYQMNLKVDSLHFCS